MTGEGIRFARVGEVHVAHLTRGEGSRDVLFLPGGVAVRAGAALVQELHAGGTDIRVGLHTGEVELRGDDLAGLAVHIAARVEAYAETGQVLVSRTVRDLLLGSSFTFRHRGDQPLKGLPEAWALFSLEEAGP